MAEPEKEKTFQFSKKKLKTELPKYETTDVKINATITSPSVTSNNEENLEYVKEPSELDFKLVPVEGFGNSMLRDMGWNEEASENSKEDELIKLRPKGLGLGAEKIIKKIEKSANNNKIKIKSNIKLLAGKYEGLYGKAEGFDESGRVKVKLADSGLKISINEFLCNVVSSEEYEKNLV